MTLNPSLTKFIIPLDARTRILYALKNGRYLLTLHALERMNVRCITDADIRCCARTAKTCVFQEEHGTWRIDGYDLGHEETSMACALDHDGTLIVTVFRGED